MVLFRIGDPELEKFALSGGFLLPSFDGGTPNNLEADEQW